MANVRVHDPTDREEAYFHNIFQEFRNVMKYPFFQTWDRQDTQAHASASRNLWTRSDEKILQQIVRPERDLRHHGAA